MTEGQKAPSGWELSIDIVKMKGKIDNIDKTVEDLSKDMKEFIKSAKTEFANKSEFHIFRDRINTIVYMGLTAVFTLVGILVKLLLF